MIDYRIIRKDDVEQVALSCSEHNMQFPSGNIIVAVDESGKVKGFVSVEQIVAIAPIVCEGNPIIADSLHKTALGMAMSTGIRHVRAWTEDRGLVNLYKRLGYKITAENATFLKKEL